MATAVRITKKEMESELQAAMLKYEPFEVPGAKEVVYRIPVPTRLASLLLYSSIVGTTSRDTGEDAIRVVPFDDVSQRPLSHAMTRVFRVTGWRTNLLIRLREGLSVIHQVKRCPICNSAMVPRIATKTGNKFMGCINFMNHPKKEAINANGPQAHSPLRRREAHTEVPPRVGSAERGRWEQPSVEHRVAPMVRPEAATAHQIEIRHVTGAYAPSIGGPVTRPTSDFPDAIFTAFKQFNPIQTAVLDIIRQDCNLILASQTNTGKTMIAEMAIASCLKQKRGPAIYASPLKALSQEKLDTWKRSDHPFSRRRISIVTGDYRLTVQRQKELDAAEIIVMTSEMLDSRCRNITSEKSAFLERAGVLVVDEMHLLGMSGRGDKLEAGLLRFSKINPKARLTVLSATIPNMEELAGWVKTLNEKKTILVSSPWRAVPLTMNFRYFQTSRRYQETQAMLYSAVFRTLEEFPNDKVLVFVHTKAAGAALLGMCNTEGIAASFHSADLELGDRLSVEEEFRSKNSQMRVVIATSTLAWGVNLPARRVIIAGVHRGLSEVSELDILQMAGRAGRMGLDDSGDAYVLLPANEATAWEDRITRPGPILSGLSKPSILKFHIISEIANGECQDYAAIRRWYMRTLAQYQGYNLSSEDLQAVVRSLLQDKAIRLDGNGFSATNLGKCANMFYLDPEDLYDYIQNWSRVFNKPDQSDEDIAWALSNLRSYARWIVSRKEMDTLTAFYDTVRAGHPTLTGGQIKAFACFLSMLRGAKIDGLSGIYRAFKADSERTVQALTYLDGAFAKWHRTDMWKALTVRFKYGVPMSLVPLCGLKGVGPVKAKALYDAGITTPAEFFTTKSKEAKRVLGDKIYGNVWDDNFAREGVMDDEV